MTKSKHVLITGAGSYIGDSFAAYAKEHYPQILTESISLHGDAWKDKDFGAYDAIFHVAGKAHADVGKVTPEEQQEYYRVNTDLAIETAKKAKADGTKQFLFMSSLIIYGDSAPFGQEKVITRDTPPEPANFYGDSKWQADQGIRALADRKFHVATLRCPMIYGPGSKGNYPTLARLAKKLPVFPEVHNERSMLYIENLCELVCQLILTGKDGIYYPQNPEITDTGRMVQLISQANASQKPGDSHTAQHTPARGIRSTKLLSPAVTLASRVPGKIGGLANKAFGNLVIDPELSRYEGLDYQKYDLAESVRRTEETHPHNSEAHSDKSDGKGERPHLLVISQYFHPETFRINDMALEWARRGYQVTVLTGIPNYPMGKFFDGYGLHKKRHEIWNGIEIIRIPLIPRGNSRSRILNSLGMAANYLSFMVSGALWNVTAKVRADLVFSYEVSPMTQVLTGCRYAKKHHVPHFLYVQDLWPENVETVTGITNPLVIRPIDAMVDKIYRETTQILTTSPAFVKAITGRKHPVPKKKVHYWPQYAEEFYRPVEREEAKEAILQAIDDPEGNDSLQGFTKAMADRLTEESTFKIAFTGNIGTAQGLDILPRAAEILKKARAGKKQIPVRFVIVGDGRYQERFEQEIREAGVEDMFLMIPRQTAEAIPMLLGCCDAAFLSFADTKLWEMTIPAKLQSYMACGMPILAAAGGETKRIIEEARCGTCVPIGDARALAEAIRDWADHAAQNSAWADRLKNNSRAYCEQYFSRERRMNQMDKAILSAVHGNLANR